MPSKKNKGYTQSLVRTCAVFVHDFSGPILASGIKLGNDIKIRAKIRVETTQGHEPSITLFLYFPDGTDNEDRGHGARFVYSQADGVYRPSPELRIGIRFRREKWTQTFEAASPELLGRFPGLKGGGGQTVITFSSDEDDKNKVCVEGMGMPYINKSEPELEQFVNENGPLIGGVTFIDFVRSNTFHVLVELQPHSAKFYFSLEQLPPPFDHPYGTLHNFDPERSALSMASNPRNHAYNVSHSFKDDNAMVTVTTQSLMQDSLYLWKQAQCIAETKLRAYFIPVPDRGDKYYAILPLPKEFMDKYKPAWQRLIDRRTCQASLARWEFPDSKVPSGFWKSHFITYTGGIQALASHPMGESDVVLVTSPPPPEEAGSQCDVSTFSSRAHLARLTMRGQGYAEWMMAMRPPVPAPAAGDQGVTEFTEPTVFATINKSVLPFRPVPKKSYLPGRDARYEQALASVCLPEDRKRWPVFLREVLLGLAIITAGPGYGKTTEMARNILAMEYSFGRVFCTAPSNVAVTNLAVRTYRITMAVCDRHNDNLPDETPRARHRMILRGYKRKDEVAAFSSLLKDPKLGDAAAPRKFGGISHWRLDLSLALWVLVLLRSPFVRELHDDDKKELHELQHEVHARGDWTSLRDMATGRISWDAYAGNSGCPPDHMETVQIIMDRLVAMADVLATTPAMIVNANEVYKDWRSDAKAVAIDGAANMDRGDLITAWGNEMLPLLCGGDPEQLPPFVLTDQSSLDTSGHVNNQFSHDGRVSAQGFLMASGHSVYRLHRQLRIGNGLFDIIGKVIYPDIPVRYGPDCDINLPQFEIGHRLEAYFRERFPDLLAPAKDKFAPIFVHCNDTMVYVNPVTGSKRSPDQVHTALSFAADFITKKSVDPSKLVILSPYKENVALIDRWRKRYPQLAGMPPPSTVNGFQGRENDVVFVMMGTRAFNPGPGFTKNRNRLNVLLTRQRCGLVIFGDIHVAGPLKKSHFGTLPQLDLPAISDYKPAKAPSFKALRKVGFINSSAPEQYRIWLLLWQSDRVITTSAKDASNDPRENGTVKLAEFNPEEVVVATVAHNDMEDVAVEASAEDAVDPAQQLALVGDGNDFVFSEDEGDEDHDFEMEDGEVEDFDMEDVDVEDVEVEDDEDEVVERPRTRLRIR
ncbi:putative helicase MAGATAMA 3 [Colletotrichum fructicola]|nr:putative helicase MAGATAMA 3 [Colletotrichum fructicola]